MPFFPRLLLAVLEGTVAAAGLALSALGLSIVFGVMRVVNVAHGEFFMLGAMLAWWTAKLVPTPPTSIRCGIAKMIRNAVVSRLRSVSFGSKVADTG